MKLSVFAVLLQDKSFDEACAYLASKGVQAVEIGCGGFPARRTVTPRNSSHIPRRSTKCSRP